MIEIVKVQVGNRTKECYQYLLFGFHTPKGTFTLVGSDTNGTDTFKELGTSNFHEWKRSQVYEWFVKGNISVVSESTTLDWYTNPIKKDNSLKRLKTSRNK